MSRNIQGNSGGGILGDAWVVRPQILEHHSHDSPLSQQGQPLLAAVSLLRFSADKCANSIYILPSQLYHLAWLNLGL